MQRAARLLGTMLLPAAACFLFAQGFGFRRDSPRWTPPTFPDKAEFHFVRLQYNDLPQHHRWFGFSSRRGRGEGWWMMDWPDAEEHFTEGVNRLTRVAAGAPRTLSLGDNRLFDHPWIYATQVGWWDLSDADTRRLAEYLRRGGFLVVDDFFGDEQWEVFRRTMERVLPDQTLVEAGDADSIMHVLYDIPVKDRVFIAGTRHLWRRAMGATRVEPPPGTVPGWYVLHDSKDRVVVAVNYNVDVGDAWEYADAPEYPEAMTTLAYRFGINYLIYSLTH